MNIINAFTGLRGVSCLAVIAAHWSNETVGLDSVSPAGGMAVIFFFVLSGYLLVKREFESMQPTPDTKPDRFLSSRAIFFNIRRFLRMYPAYIAVCLIYKYVYVGMCKAKGDNDTTVWNFDRDFSILLSMKDNRSHLWTMSAEVVFSIVVLPILLAICSELMILDHKFLKKTPIKLNIIFFIALHFLFDPMVSLIKFFEQPHGFGNPLYNVFKPFWYGCLGGAASYYINYFGLNPKIEGGYKRLAAELATYALLIRIYFGNKMIAIFWGLPPMNDDQDLAPWYVLFLLVIEFSATCNSFGKLVSTEIITHIGEISYSTYLIHLFFIKYVMLNYTARGIDGLAITYAYTLVAGQILYTVVEKSSIKIGSFIIKKIKNSNKWVQDKLQAKQSNFVEMDEQAEELGESGHVAIELETDPEPSSHK